MKMLTISGIIITGAILLNSCQSSVDSQKKNDTTLAVKILLDSAFYAPRLVPISPLIDTVIFQYDNILVHHLPKQLPHKLLRESEMCEFMAARKISYLRFFSLELVKTSNGYRTALGTHCMSRGIQIKEPEGTQNCVCEREKYCNVVLNMDVIKRKNDFTGSKFTIMTY